jgi:hypothetical protein
MPSPGAILLGALLGLGGGVVGALPLLGTGIADTHTIGGQMVLITVGFGAQFLSGFVAARLARSSHGLNGGLAALLAYLAVAMIALASPDEPSLFTLGSGAVIALVLGTAAGVLAEARSA